MTGWRWKRRGNSLNTPVVTLQTPVLPYPSMFTDISSTDMGIPTLSWSPSITHTRQGIQYIEFVVTMEISFDRCYYKSQYL